MKRIDTHQHLWDLGQFPCSWCAGLPALNRNFLLADYLAAAQGAGIDKTVFVECDVDEPHSLAEAQHIQKLSETNPLIAGLVASARPNWKPCCPWANCAASGAYCTPCRTPSRVRARLSPMFGGFLSTN